MILEIIDVLFIFMVVIISYYFVSSASELNIHAKLYAFDC